MVLCVSVRTLSGAIYHYVSWLYVIVIRTVYAIFEDTLVAIDQSLDKIGFPTTE